uniref:Proliferating cell nuclear antigen PCNA N-terminal domain-containing protein n=1 Tax=viral metagenome TaxID=1070528 RepID=A0A6C0ITI8_9ZZZZ
MVQQLSILNETDKNSEINKLQIFVSIFTLLKSWGSTITMRFSQDELFIQSMDKSHICLADIKLKKDWFTTYSIDKDIVLSVDSNMFSLIMSYSLKHPNMELICTNDDKLDIRCVNIPEKVFNVFDHFFQIPLMDIDQDELGIPEVEYDVDIVIEAKSWTNILNELNELGQNVQISCKENEIRFITEDNARLEIKIEPEVLIEYGISEGVELVESQFSLKYLSKMCSTTKLTQTINVGLSDEIPLSIKYDLGEGSKICFYLAPKVSNDE